MQTKALGIMCAVLLWMAPACGQVSFEHDPSDSGATDGASGQTGANGEASVGDASAAGPASTGCTLITSAQNRYWQQGECTEVPNGSADVTVNEATTAQTWDGFGGAFNEVGWNCLSLLTPQEQNRAIELLFGADGAHFAIGRIPMGANDYALDRYSEDEVTDDLSLNAFSISRDQQYLIPFVQAALTVNPDLRLWSIPWTPPTWMKQGPFGSGKGTSAFDGGSMKDDDATLAAYAQYFVKFVQEYAKQGIAIEIVAPQNEPSSQHTYPSCSWSAELYTKFVGQYLGPALDQGGLSTKIMGGTMSSGDKDYDVLTTVMADDAARPYVKLLGLQWGMSSYLSGTRAYGVPVWQSEHQSGNYPWKTGTFNNKQAPNDHAYAVESWGLIRDWIKGGVTSYSAWNMVLDPAGIGNDTSSIWPQNSLLVVDTVPQTLIVTPTYYVFRHLSQYVTPGATLLGASGGDALAFKNPDGSIIVTTFNSGAAKTSYTISTGHRSVQFAMPANGWATLVMR